MINITFPDGSVKQFEKEITPKEIAKSISVSLAKNTVGAIFNDHYRK